MPYDGLPGNNRLMPSNASHSAILCCFFVFFLALCPAQLHATEGTACHPDLDWSEPQFVIGYGSLMDTLSKDRTWADARPAVPVRVTGFERSWNTRGTLPGFSTTYLGVAEKSDATMVAALYRAQDTRDFETGDAREYVYCRVAVARDQLDMLDGSGPPPRGKFWIYLPIPESVRPADARFPIIQSYVDIFLSGCIELAKQVTDPDVDFVTQCVTTTKGWPMHWVNDRIYPRRPFHQPNATRIDTLLQRLLPEQFKAIRIE